eukprot:367430-Rhodomonas_salina.5
MVVPGLEGLKGLGRLSAIELRMRYAKSGTDVGYAMPCPVLREAAVLRPGPDTDEGAEIPFNDIHGGRHYPISLCLVLTECSPIRCPVLTECSPTQCPVLTSQSYAMPSTDISQSYAMPGTDIAYGGGPGHFFFVSIYVPPPLLS